METATATTSRGTILDTAALNGPEQDFADWLETVVIGQPNGKRATRRAFRRTMSKLQIRRTPLGTFIFLGPSTCGKSELAYRLAEYVHGDRECLLKIDGSEYIHDANITKLIGGTNQWVGRVDKSSANYVPPKANEKDTSAELTQHNISVYARHRSKTGRNVTICLVDEWEKACREFNDIFLSIMRDGRYTLGGSEDVDFSECIFIFTGNLGSRAVELEKEKLANPLGFANGRGITHDEIDKLVTKHLADYAAPEFRKRVVENGEIVIFDELTPEQVLAVCDVKVRELGHYLHTTAGVTLTVEEPVKSWLLKKCDGLAEVTGGLKTYIGDKLDNELIKKTITTGDSVVVFVDDAEKLDVEPQIARAVKQIQIVTDLNDPSALEATKAFDATLAGRHLRQDEVDMDAVRRAASGNGADESSTDKADGADAKPKGRVFQPFLITLLCENDAALANQRTQLYALLKRFEISILGEETRYGVKVQTAAGIVSCVLTNVHVIGLIEKLRDLKEAAPALKVKTEEAEL